MKNIFFIILFLSGLPSVDAQSNTAVESGVIGKCGVWDYPYTLYNNGGASQIINDGVTVTVDQNRNIGAVNYTGSGGMNFAGGNGITLSGGGGEINCRWEIPGGGNYTIVNNDGQQNVNNAGRYIAPFFTAPYNGIYVWIRRGGWSANVSGAFLNANINIRNDATGTSSSFFYQNQPGSCGQISATSPTPAEWDPGFAFPMAAGQVRSYTAGTGYSNQPGCTNTTLTFTRGAATMFFDN